MIAESDGFVVVTVERAAQVVEEAERRAKYETRLLADASDGILDFAWVDEALDIIWLEAGDTENGGQ